MFEPPTRKQNESFLRTMRVKGVGVGRNEATVGMDRAYLVLDELDETRAELATTKARLDGTSSAIPAIVANHTKSIRAELTRFITAYESMRRRFGNEYEGRFAECDALVQKHDTEREKRG